MDWLWQPFFYGVGVVMFECGGLGESEVPREVRRVGGRVVTFSGVWGVQGRFRG